jgi:hypothetical protein
MKKATMTTLCPIDCTEYGKGRNGGCRLDDVRRKDPKMPPCRVTRMVAAIDAADKLARLAKQLQWRACPDCLSNPGHDRDDDTASACRRCGGTAWICVGGTGSKDEWDEAWLAYQSIWGAV